MLFELMRRRRRARLTQRQLGDLAGVHGHTVSRLESGAVANPEIHTLRKLAAALDTTPESLFPELFGPSSEDSAA